MQARGRAAAVLGLGRHLVVSGHVARDDLPHMGWLCLAHRPASPQHVECQVAQIAGYVGVGGAGPVVGGQRAAHFHQLVGDDRQVVLSACQALTKANVAPGLALDVSDTSGGAAQGGLVGVVAGLLHGVPHSLIVPLDSEI